MSKKQQLHPLLATLFSKNGKRPAKGAPSALTILNQLLLRNEVAPEAVQSAYDAIVSTPPSLPDKAKSESKTDTPQYRYRHVALRIYYDGADYSGLAQNMGQESDQSVEKAFFQALIKTKMVQSRETSGYSRCGRTDKGVSSAGQVLALKIRSNIPLDATMEDGSAVTESDLPKNSVDSIRVCVSPKKGNGPNTWKDLTELEYGKILNSVLPSTIRVLGWCPVSSDFSARFSATTRTYRYFFVPRQMDLGKMREALSLLVGKHDFRNFCKMDVEKVYNFERQIHSAELVECKTECYLQVIGQAFLWHQIRCIASVLFLVGRGLEEPSVVTDLLNVEKHPGKPSYPLAADRPLVLHHCGYPNLQMGHSARNLWAVSCHMEQQWEDLILAAARVRNCLDTMSEATLLKRDLVDFANNKLQERIKKRNKHKGNNGSSSIIAEDIDDKSLPSGPTLTWGQALDWMAERDFCPDPQGIRETAHIPLLQRSRGTTYEEKIEALSSSKRRQQKYEENVIKKRKTAEEDAAFYEHMTKQGGTGI